MTKGRKIQIACILLAAVLWGAFAVTRCGEFTAYIPFSGRIFDIDPAAVDRIFIQNGTTGEQIFFETAAEKESVANRLNALRYSCWVPTIPIAKGGWSYRVAIEANGKQYSYYFSERDILVNGIAYVLPEEQLAGLMQYVD